MKKGKILAAKIIIVVVLVITFLLGMLKLIDHLSEPKNLFTKVIESSFTELHEVFNPFSTDPLFNIINNKTILNAETKLILSNQQNTEFGEYQGLIGKSNFVTKISIDNEKKYFDFDMTVSKEDARNIHFIYNKNGNNEYIQKPEEKINFLEFNRDIIYKNHIDSQKNVEILNIIKKHFADVLTDENYELSEEPINIGPHIVDSLVSSYSLKGTNLNILLDKIINDIYSNETLLAYIGNLYDVDSTKAREKLGELQNSLNIIPEKVYYIKCHVAKSNERPLKISLTDDNNMDIISYSSDTNSGFKTLAFKNFTINIEKIGEITTFDYITDKKFLTISVDGTVKPRKYSIKIKDVQENKILNDIMLECLIEDAENNSKSISVTGYIDFLVDNQMGKLEVNSSLKAEVGKEIITRTITKTEKTDIYNDKDFRFFANDVLKYINDYMTPSEGNVPVTEGEEKTPSENPGTPENNLTN